MAVGVPAPAYGIPALWAAVAEPGPLTVGAEAAGDPVAVLPVLFHLLWRQELATAVAVPLHPAAAVAAIPAAA